LEANIDQANHLQKSSAKIGRMVKVPVRDIGGFHSSTTACSNWRAGYKARAWRLTPPEQPSSHPRSTAIRATRHQRESAPAISSGVDHLTGGTFITTALTIRPKPRSSRRMVRKSSSGGE